jgi:hypothetical protein
MNLCLTSTGRCYNNSHDYEINRGRSKICCCYCQKRCCVTHRYWICLNCYELIKPLLPIKLINSHPASKRESKKGGKERSPLPLPGKGRKGNENSEKPGGREEKKRGLGILGEESFVNGSFQS